MLIFSFCYFLGKVNNCERVYLSIEGDGENEKEDFNSLSQHFFLAKNLRNLGKIWVKVRKRICQRQHGLLKCGPLEKEI